MKNYNLIIKAEYINFLCGSRISKIVQNIDMETFTFRFHLPGKKYKMLLIFKKISGQNYLTSIKDFILSNFFGPMPLTF